MIDVMKKDRHHKRKRGHLIALCLLLGSGSIAGAPWLASLGWTQQAIVSAINSRVAGNPVRGILVAEVVEGVRVSRIDLS